MSQSVPPSLKRRLAARLRREARATRPAFSESLHRRIVEAVRREAEASRSSRPEFSISPHRRHEKRPAEHAKLSTRFFAARLAVASAVCLALVAAVVGWRVALSERPASFAPEEMAFSPPVPSSDVLWIETLTDQAAAGFGRLDSTLAMAPQADDLKHDARLAAHALLRQLPIDLDLVDAVAFNERAQ